MWAVIGIIAGAWLLLAVAGFLLIVSRMNRLDRRTGYALPPLREVRDHPVQNGSDVLHAADAARRIH